MPENSIITELSSFLNQCPLEDFIDKLSEVELAPEETINIQDIISQIKYHESNLRILRQRIEYQVRKHKLQEFRNRS